MPACSNDLQNPSPQIQHHPTDFTDPVDCACVAGRDHYCYLGEAKPNGVAFSRFEINDCYSCSETNCKLMLSVTPLCKPDFVMRYPKQKTADSQPPSQEAAPRTFLQP